MRTNIEIDDRLMAEAMAAFGTRTKRETVEEALREAIRLRRQHGFREMRGQVDWVGDLDAMRRD